MAVLIGGVTPRDTVSDDATLFLGAPWGVHALTVGGRAFVYGQGESDDGVSVFELTSDGQLTNVQNVADDATLQLDGADNFASAVIGGVTYLYVNGFNDDGISAFSVGANGTLTPIDNEDDTGANLALDGTEGRMATTTVGGQSFLIATGVTDDGFSVFRIESNGTLTNTTDVFDAGALELDGAEDAATATVDGRTFVFVAGRSDDGLSVFELAGNGLVSSVQNVVDDAALELDGAWGVATATVAGATYLIASGSEDDGLSVFRVGAGGTLTAVFNITDDATTELDGASSLSTFTVDTETFVAVSSSNDDAINIFHLGAGGGLTDVTSIFSSIGFTLDDTLANAFVNLEGRAFVIGNSRTAGSLSSFELGAANDTLNGTSDADIILGLAGNDRLNGAAGDDRVVGGVGDDFLQGRAGRDQLLGLNGSDELQGGRDNDNLAGGARADILWGGNGRDVMAGEGGADDFVFLSIRESGTTNGTRDVITDFRGRDDLVFTGIDADRGQAGNQDFTFDTGGAFAAGEIRFREVARGVLVELNIDNDQAAEFSVLLRDFTGTLNGNDFEV